MDNKKERSFEDITGILSLAKLNTDDIQPVYQSVYFTPDNLYEHNYKLLQLDPHLLEDLTEGSKLCFKSENDEEVVICSNNNTYQVVAAETSNTLLLAQDLKFSKDIEDTAKPEVHKVMVKAIFYEYLEATLSKPHLKKIDELLNKSLYKGPEHEYDVIKENLLTFEELCEKVQASQREIKDFLNSITIIEIDNKIRLLDLEYHFRVLSYMLKLIDENSWDLDEIDFTITMESLKDLVPKEIIANLFDKYTEESKEVDGMPVYRYKEDEVCKFFAQVLLRETGKFNLNEFLQAWGESVPEGMVPNEEMLFGIAIIDSKSSPPVIRAFDESNLPEDINERFKILFETKDKWSVPEISPYIQRLTTEKLDVNALLAKYARASKVNGTKYYSSKHGK